MPDEQPQPEQTDANKVHPPANHAEASPLNGVIPPPEHRWQPGQSGNPKGRPNAGAVVKEWFNELHDATEEELDRIARDRRASPAKRAAAIQWLDILAGAVDLSDCESYVDGSEKLSDLKAKGIAARAIRKVKETRRSGDWGEETKREVELSDRGAQALDRIMDRTAGKPQQQIDVTSQGESIRPILVAPGSLSLVEWQQQVQVLQTQKPPAGELPAEGVERSGEGELKRA